MTGTRSTSSRRVLQRAALRDGSAGVGSVASRCWDRLGLDLQAPPSPWSMGPWSSVGRLVYLTLPWEDLEDEELEEQTAAQIIRRAAPRRSARRAPPARPAIAAVARRRQGDLADELPLVAESLAAPSHRLSQGSARAPRAERPLDRVARAPQRVRASHEARLLQRASGAASPRAAGVLSRAAEQVDRAPAHRRERIVRAAVRALSPTQRLRVSPTIEGAARQGASAVASVAARAHGLGRGDSAMRPMASWSPALVALEFEEPNETLDAPDSAPSQGHVAPRRAELRRSARALRETRSQLQASRAGPPPAAPRDAGRGPLQASSPRSLDGQPVERKSAIASHSRPATATAKAARRLMGLLDSRAPSFRRGLASLQAPTSRASEPDHAQRAPASGSPARVAAPPDGSAVLLPDSGSGRESGSRLRRALQRSSSAPQRASSIGASVARRLGQAAEPSSTRSIARSQARASTRRMFGSPTSYVTLDVEPVRAVEDDQVVPDAQFRAAARQRRAHAAPAGRQALDVSRDPSVTQLVLPRAPGVPKPSVRAATRGVRLPSVRPGAVRSTSSATAVDLALASGSPEPGLSTVAARSAERLIGRAVPAVAPPGSRRPLSASLSPRGAAHGRQRRSSADGAVLLAVELDRQDSDAASLDEPQAVTSRAPRRGAKTARSNQQADSSPRVVGAPLSGPRSTEGVGRPHIRTAAGSLRAAQRGLPASSAQLSSSPIRGDRVSPSQGSLEPSPSSLSKPARPTSLAAVRGRSVAGVDHRGVVRFSRGRVDPVAHRVAAVGGSLSASPVRRSALSVGLELSTLDQVDIPSSEALDGAAPQGILGGPSPASRRGQGVGVRAHAASIHASQRGESGPRDAARSLVSRSSASGSPVDLRLSVAERAEARGRGAHMSPSGPLGSSMVVLEPTLPESASDLDADDGAVSRPSVRASARGLQAVRSDGRGVARSFSGATSYLDISASEAEVRDVARSPVVRSRFPASGPRSIVLSDHGRPTASGFEGQRAELVSGSDLERSLRSARRRLRRDRRLASRRLAMDPVVIQPRPETDAADQESERVRSTGVSARVGPSGWAAARVGHASARSMRRRSRLPSRADSGAVDEPALESDRPVSFRRRGTAPVRRMGDLSEMAWLNPMAGQSVDEDLSGDEPSGRGVRTGSPGRARAAIVGRRSVGDGSAPFAPQRRPWTGAAPRTGRRRSGVQLERGQLAVPEGAQRQPVVTQDAPGWSARAGQTSGARRSATGERISLRASSTLVNAIARAESPDELVRIISDGRFTPEQLRRDLPGPAAKLVQRVEQMHTIAQQAKRTEARHEHKRARRGRGLEPDATELGGSPTFIPVATGAGNVTGLTSGAARMTQLANKLLRLIHLAEVDQRVQEAQQQVRMSDSEPGTSGAGAAGTSSDVQSPNINALKRDVFEAVLRKLNELEGRSVEDPNGHAMWW